jgi:hypothetical protein
MLAPEEAIPAQINATPVGPDFSALDGRTRAQIVAQVAQAMAPYLVPEGMEIPQGAVVVTATK